MSEGVELQQQLKDQVCALIQRDDVLVLVVDYEEAKDGFPASITVQYKENVSWKEPTPGADTEVEVLLDEDLILFAALEAHKQNITLNQYLVSILEVHMKESHE